LLAGVPAGAPAVPDDLILSQAEAALADGLRVRGTPDERAFFQKAAAAYEELGRRGHRNAALFRNQGNACLLAGDLPSAILAYRRGLRLAPQDKGLQADLTYARDRVAYPSADPFGRPPVGHWPPWLPRLSAWGYVAVIACWYGLAWVGLTRWRMTRQGRTLGLALAAFALAALFALGLVFEEWQHHQELLHPVVVIGQDGTFLRKGNGSSYPNRYDTPLNRGAEARLHFARGSWLHIELAGGEAGWVPRSAVLVDQP
jgi:hypothetical protein